MLAIILLIAMGAASVIGSEMLSVMMLLYAPAALNLTDDFFITLVLPSIAIVVAFNGLILWKVFARSSGLRTAIYAASYAAAYTAMLTGLNNPPGDIATYIAFVLIASTLILGVFYAMFWRPRT